MSLFRKRKDICTVRDYCVNKVPEDTTPMLAVYKEPEVRPCMVCGRRAIFHRWVNSAHPVPPRGTEINENTRYYQFRRTEALVEYEDGTIDRVYPTEIRFVDGGAFDRFDWCSTWGRD